MSVERHLVLQDMTLQPSAEWFARSEGWMVVRVAEGVGYWLNAATPRELGVGDVLIVPGNCNGLLRASQLGLLRIQFFFVQPRLLDGVLAISDGQQLDPASANAPAQALIGSAHETIGRKFTQLAGQPAHSSLSLRCQLLQLWADAVGGLIKSHAQPVAVPNLRDRLRELFGQMSQAELLPCSLRDLAGRLHCSERHLSRLFREEFGVAFRAHQTELRLMRAREILADSEVKIINVAYGSGYRHLGLFNAMFKKRFGMTPREWRRQHSQQTGSTRLRNPSSKPGTLLGLAILLLGFFLGTPAPAQTNEIGTADMTRARAALYRKMRELDEQEGKAKAHIIPVSINGPFFEVENYLVEGNTLLPARVIQNALMGVPAAFGTNVTFDAVRAALGDLQMAYRERGFVTVSVGLPQQKLTNATVRVQVTEGRLDAINVVGNRWYSSNNIMRALPGLHTNMLLNSHVFQRELDTANASRDRQIYPIIGPGVDPGTSDLTLKVKDSFPLHARFEMNNQATPGTPDIRANASLQYDNLWDREHQVGLQYSFNIQEYRESSLYSMTPFDSPLVANQSGYYRLPLGPYTAVQEQVDANPGSFGYSDVTHKFTLPPATGRPDLTIYASRAINDTGVIKGPKAFLVDTTATNSSGVLYHPLSITTNSAGQNITLNEDLGLKFSIPTPQLGESTTLYVGADYKHFRSASFNTNENLFETQFYDQQGVLNIDDVPAPQAQAPRFSQVNYFPVNVGLSTSVPDKFGSTFFNATLNFTVVPISSQGVDMTNTVTEIVTNGNTTATNHVTKITKLRNHYATLQLGADRIQALGKDWSVRLHADGQWADGPLFSNEQFAMGGTGGVRGYADGEAYGDTGWRVSIEPRTPLVNVGTADFSGSKQPVWVRGSAFVDYGEIYRFDTSTGLDGREKFCGVGLGMTANIGNHLDARIAIAWPLIGTQLTRPGDLHAYFGAGLQF